MFLGIALHWGFFDAKVKSWRSRLSVDHLGRSRARGKIWLGKTATERPGFQWSVVVNQSKLLEQLSDLNIPPVEDAVNFRSV